VAKRPFFRQYNERTIQLNSSLTTSLDYQRNIFIFSKIRIDFFMLWGDQERGKISIRLIFEIGMKNVWSTIEFF